jgi:hypothetical protein
VERRTVAASKPTTRSKVTNGRNLFVDSDGRGAWARRFRDLCTLHIEDLGGSLVLSEAQGSLIRRAATLEVELERLEGRLAKGEDVDLDAYSRAAGHLRRILETLGIERRKRDVTPSIADIAASLGKGAPA